jgi:hypothetical protein
MRGANSPSSARARPGGQPSCLPAVYLDMMAPVVRIVRDGEHEFRMIRWGFPASPNLGMAPVRNMRNLKSLYWRCWLKSE